METRMRMPPDSSRGRAWAKPLQPDLRAAPRSPPAAAARRPWPAQPERQPDVLGGVRPGQQRRILEHEADLARRRAAPPSQASRPPSGASSPAISRSRVDLPQPDGPSRARKSPRLQARARRRASASVPLANRRPRPGRASARCRLPRHPDLVVDELQRVGAPPVHVLRIKPLRPPWSVAKMSAQRAVGHGADACRGGVAGGEDAVALQRPAARRRAARRSSPGCPS